MSTENLKYLTSRQAIEDLANFIKFIRQRYNLNSGNKWVSFGGSYPGSLSALIRAKYPDLIHASFSSSAPMFIVSDFPMYMEVIQKSLDAYSPYCSIEISKAYQTIQAYMQTYAGIARLKSLFKSENFDD